MAESLAGGVAWANKGRERRPPLLGSLPQFLFRAHPKKQVKPRAELRG